MKTLKNGFLGSDEGKSYETVYEKAKAIIVPYGFEATVTYGSGTKNGPKAIIKASHQVEVIDEQTMQPAYRAGVATLDYPKISKKPQTAFRSLGKIVSQIVQQKKFPIVLGGEHSISQASLEAICDFFGKISVLHFDAHPDMREHYHGTTHSHASVFYQVLKKLPIMNIVQVGIRNISDSNKELDFRKANSRRIKTYWGWENSKPQDVAKNLKSKDVFISFDLDAFDPSIMPSTGTPEPGGLSWWPTLEILKAVFKRKNVVGADVVELAPMKGMNAPDFLAARLVYKMIGYKYPQKAI